MESIIKKLGKTSITVEKDYHSSKKEYNKLTIVEEEGTFKTYLSRKPVPVNTELTNREYWIPFSGIKESLIINYEKFKKEINNNINSIVIAYLIAHPELIVNVQDKSINIPKLAKDVINWFDKLQSNIDNEAHEARLNEQKNTDAINSEINRAKSVELNIQKTLENITKTGEASAASNVTYVDNIGVGYINIQDTIDELGNKALDEEKKLSKLNLEVGIKEDAICVYTKANDVGMMWSISNSKVIASSSTSYGILVRLNTGIKYKFSSSIYTFNKKPVVHDTDYIRNYSYNTEFVATENEKYALTVNIENTKNLNFTTYAHGLSKEISSINQSIINYNLLDGIDSYTTNSKNIEINIISKHTCIINGQVTQDTTIAFAEIKNKKPFPITKGYYTFEGIHGGNKNTYSMYYYVYINGIINAINIGNESKTVYFDKDDANAEIAYGVKLMSNTEINEEVTPAVYYTNLPNNNNIADISINDIKDTILISSKTQTSIKNLLPIGPSRTISTMHMSAKDGIYTINGIFPDTISVPRIPIVLSSENREIQKGTYTLSGFENGSNTTYRLYLFVFKYIGEFDNKQMKVINVIYQYNKPTSFSVIEDAYYMMGIQVNQGICCKNLTISPMLTYGYGSSSFVAPNKDYNVTPLISTNSIAMGYIVSSIMRPWKTLHSINFDITKEEELYGIPYHQGLHYKGCDVLINRNLIAFFSAMENPASIQYQTPKGDRVNYGTMCSSLTHWLYGQKVFKLTNELINTLDILDYDRASCLEVGDVIISYNGTGHIIAICGLDIDNYGQIRNIKTIESAYPLCEYNNLSISKFEELLDKGYKVARYKNYEIVKQSAIRYAKDIITEYGNNTYFKEDDDIWCWINDTVSSTNLYIEKEGITKTISISSLPTKNISILDDFTDSDETWIDYKVYNLKDELKGLGEYKVSTTEHSKLPCVIKKIDCGTIRKEETTLIFEGWSCKPIWCYINFDGAKQIGYGVETSYEIIDGKLNISNIPSGTEMKIYTYYDVEDFGEALHTFNITI